MDPPATKKAKVGEDVPLHYASPRRGGLLDAMRARGTLPATGVVAAANPIPTVPKVVNTAAATPPRVGNNSQSPRVDGMDGSVERAGVSSKQEKPCGSSMPVFISSLLTAATGAAQARRGAPSPQPRVASPQPVIRLDATPPAGSPKAATELAMTRAPEDQSHVGTSSKQLEAAETAHSCQSPLKKPLSGSCSSPAMVRAAVAASPSEKSRKKQIQSPVKTTVSVEVASGKSSAFNEGDNEASKQAALGRKASKERSPSDGNAVQHPAPVDTATVLAITPKCAKSKKKERPVRPVVPRFSAPDPPMEAAEVAFIALRKMPLGPIKPEDNYEISDKEDSADEAAVERAESARLQKRIPAWCGDYEKRVLEQATVDPDCIFGPRVPTIDMDRIFPDSFYKLRGCVNPRRKRGSSCYWHRDRLKQAEITAYREKMGQKRRWSLLRQKAFIVPKVPKAVKGTMHAGTHGKKSQ